MWTAPTVNILEWQSVAEPGVTLIPNPDPISKIKGTGTVEIKPVPPQMREAKIKIYFTNINFFHCLFVYFLRYRYVITSVIDF